ncbi:hypothetical protein GGX14DRAFT_655950 [Mycena pura]|uniref:RNA polymerase II-associated protein 3 n=1 Tax=Mycena pura TaxID=153505 RepID=A0AAD6V2N6_9AGAR|nr:hypothetical protein GGX14DRAFT_655950 [Mycena pura]
MAQAAKEKEKGNAAFKAGDYPTAIGHYSAAIHTDRNDATLPLNRAAAYLKLGKNEDAERDCTTVLTLSKGNVKALFRRAQARIGMGKLSDAQQDLTEAAKLEPANQSVKQESGKVAEMIQRATSVSAKDASSTIPPKRRRIPITIVEADDRRLSDTPVEEPRAPPAAKPPSTSNNAPKPGLKTRITEPTDMMEPISSRPLHASSSNGTVSTPPTSSVARPQPAAQPTSKPSSFKDAKNARDNNKPSILGGGIFRASGENTIFARNPTPTKQETPLTAATPPVEKHVPPPPAPAPAVTSATNASPAQIKSPMTLFSFTRAWESTSDPTARFALLSQIPPGALPSLFQMSFEPGLFVEIIDVLEAAAPSAGLDAVGAYMRAFPGVPRFGTVLRFLSAAERACVRGVWSTLGIRHPDGGRCPAQLEEAWGAAYR